ncbi:DNA-dependent protein kinase catalytic subunit [Etheostoma cragini]|uniref:DNA-dependent protein kinase catalytic subunit n=1 Tax=Etheostoma cragini TaxID=417921 RepID=UPI00155DFDBA|nr:DNA-dependent protein kinase catalytic subunit [Etheostoma cragini]
MSSDITAAGGIQGLLLKLHESLSCEDSRAAALTCHDIVGELGQECMLTATENELALQTSLLFSKDYGLLSFLRKSLASEEFRDTRVEILGFLEKFLDKVSPRVKGWEKTYAIDIRHTCMAVYTKEKVAKCRTAVLELLIKVLQKTKASSVAADLQISEIFNRYYSELCQKSKLPDSVLGKIYELLGVLAEVHPSEMVSNSDKLYKAYLGELKEQMTSLTKEPKLFVVAGCLRGVTALMVNFTKTMEEDPATSKDIFQYALKAITPQMVMSRYAVTFAGLRLLARHASQFSSCLMDHYRPLFEVMSKLCGHINAEMKKTSYYALEAFLKQVAMLVADNIEEHKSKLKFFMHKFCGIIKTMDSTHKELSIAIRGYGFFAGPCKKVCPQDVDLMYTELIQRCKQMYLTESDGEDESFYQLPSFLDSIASVLIHLDKIPEVYTPLLERLLVVQIDSFPQYSERMQTTCCRSILKVLVAVASKGPVLWSFISSVVHQGLIRVCSKPILLSEDKDESSQVRTGKWKVPSSQNYLALFQSLLDCDLLKDSGFLDGAFESQNPALISLSRLLYDELVKSILRIVEKLDLSVHKVTTGEQAPDDAAHVLPSSDPTAHLLPNKIKDFTAFINLVDFCSELLLNKHVEYFQSWMYHLSHELILHSIRNPLVSGFYKLLSVTLKIAKRIKYYQGVGPRCSTSPQSDTVKSACFALFSKFGKEVCVRMKQYKDELLASCLTFVLSLHHSIVALDIKAYCPALEAALKLGLSHVPLANVALDALEDWSSHIPLETMQHCYTTILPLLDGYLKTSSNNKEDSNWEVMSSVSSRNTDKGYSRVMTRLLKQSNQLTMEDAPLVMVRLRVVKLLGHLGGKLNRNLVTVVSSEETMKKFVAWDSEKRLSFAVPFADMKPVIYLDPFLPHISELALSTSDRQTKVAACELLHSLVVYMVGKSAQMVEGENKLPPMYKLHKRLFPVLLRLACDVDQIDSSVCSDINHEAFRPVFSTFTMLLVDMNLPLNLKSQALLVLPFFTTLPEEPLAELQRALDALVAAHFPMQSDEFSKGSLHRNNYMDCIRKLLDALELSQSPLLLKLMAGILCRDRKHIMEDAFQTCFQRLAKRSSGERQMQLLCTVYGLIQRGDVPVSSMLQPMSERVLLPLASHCSTKALCDFFVANVSDIIVLLLSRFTKSNESEFEIQLMKKKGCYTLMELLYSRLPKEEVYSKESCINRAYCRSDKTEGNELSKTLIKSCFEAFTENMTGETQLLELRRHYHCAAYNCSIAVISCSFNEPKFYQGFLFSEKPEKNQFILENIIDIERTYRFPIEIEVPLERKKKYVMIRKEVSEEHEEKTVYLSSQSYMADSSLSEEMSQFDFSTGVQSFSFSSQNPEGRRRTVAKRETEETNLPQDAMVDLEMDELNQHECMATMTALIGHMLRNNITPKIEPGNVPSELPPWMKFLHAKLANPATPLNIRLFISKLIINTEEVFRPYAKHWLGPLMQVIVSGNNGGEGIHFMVVDIVVIVLSWTSLASPKDNPRDEVLANRLLEFLMKHCFHSKKAVFRHNLEIIRTLVECWKDCLHVPYSLIYERFRGIDPNSKDNSVGLQLLGIILANNLPAYDALCGIEYDGYIQSLTNNVSFVRYKEVYAAAAEIIGLILKNMAEVDKHRQELLSLAASKITNLKKKDMDDKFIICLNKVSKHFPPFMDRFVNYVFSLLPKLHGILKTYCLECVLSRADVIPDIFLHLKTTGFIETMRHRDEARQRVCLDIIHKIVAQLTPVQLQELLGAVTAFVCHPSPVCRERMYDILMWIQDNYSDAESMEDSTSVEVLNAAKETLLQGLSEENQGLQLYVRNFWSQEKRLPTATLERMVTVLRSLYSCRIEKCFLSLATNLLLEMTSQSPDFQRNMFEYPLSECTFQDYMIDSNWRFRSTVMTPMFVETQSSQGPESVAASQAGGMKGKLRATQSSLEFSQTQTAGRRPVYDWLTGSSVDTLADYTLGSESLSSLLVFDKKAEKQTAARRPVGEGFGLRRLTASTDEVDSRTRAANEQRNNILRLRRRFLKDQEKVSLGFAHREIQQQRQKKEDKADQRLRKEAQVTLYRNYRVGDFPDIQIPYSSLIAPLQALAQRDPILAKQLFSSLFAGILQEMGAVKARGESGRIKEELRCSMNTFLSKSTLCFPPFIACVQEMCYQHKELQQLNPAHISSTCLMSLQQPSGILLLEEGLLHVGGQDQPPAKRSRGRKEIPPDTNKWIHLARLYRSLEDYDVVRGIFGGKVGTKSITCAALQAEANTDFAEAVKLYNEALNTEHWSDDEPTESEKDFWEIAAMEAYSHLTEWKSLQYCSTVNIDENSPPNLERMWSDPIYQEMYLQHMIRSMLKQLQQGETDQTLLTFIDRAMRVEERKKLLESHYSQELSMLYILQEDYDRAKYYTNYAMQLFMQNYSSVDTLLTQSRLTILQSVQALTEIQDFLLFIKGEVSVSSLKRLIRLWTERYPDAKADPVNLWDDIITSRCFFLDKIKEKLRGHAPSDSMEVDGSEDPAGDVHTLVNDCKFNMKLRMADSAWKQNNFPVATKLLKELHKEAKTNRGWLLQWVHSFSRYNHRRSQAQGPVEQITAMLKTIPLLEELQADCRSATAKVFRYQKILQGTSFHILATAVSRSPSVLDTIGAEKAERIAKLSGASWPKENSKKVEVGLQVQALQLLCDASRKADEEIQSYSQDCVESSSIIETYMALANFCDKRLREEEQRDTESHFPDLYTLPVQVVENMLKALKMNSEEARLKFPRLLQIIELYPSETLDLMTKEMMSVPCWMLIGWISQMVALLDKPEAVAMQHCIGQIAECYPHSLVYALMISSESYQFEDSATGHQQQEFVNRLRSMLDKGGAVSNFVDALQQLTNPEMLFKDWWDCVKNELEKPSFDKKRMGAMYDEMHSALGDRNTGGHGTFRTKFIKKFAKDVEKLLGSKGSKLFEKRTEKSFVRQVDNLAASMRGWLQEPGNLKEYSPWLSGFRADTFCNELEVPGQYDGRSKPLPEYHAKITGFDERVKVMSSIRRPKRLIIRGDDERDHPFLVKGGEDLRQDQRIEQLFAVMNILLSHDAACTHRGMQLRTYQVIPITTRIGLIEWMENTCTLKEFLNSTMTDEESQRARSSTEDYNKWLQTFAPKSEGIVLYSWAYKKAKRSETVNNFSKVLQHVPADLLKRAFLKMCNSPEAFLSLRSHFISSHALLCVSHWVLGIGDRHLSNFMINMDTGGMVGIDFGHAFGSATQFLPVPELMPFRLTQQFVNLMQPLKESGLIQSIMVHSLRAYSAEPDLLLNTMDVFVKEPSLDWKNFELKQLKKGGTWTDNVNTKEISWYPLQKVNFARRKLEGANPAAITSEELALGFEKDPAFPGLQAVALGSEEHNIRARLPAAGLPVEKQVDCLLDQAMDPNVLGRVWVGWEPWM